MPKKWKIKKLDGLDVVEEWSVFGALTEPEIYTMLQRLVSRNLSDAEVINSSLRKNDPKYLSHLERTGRGNPISYGDYTAEIEDD